MRNSKRKINEGQGRRNKMSFSENIKNELAEQPRKTTCCKKAFAYGLLINSDISDNEEITFITEHLQTAHEAEVAFSEQFKRPLEISESTRIGHRRLNIRFSSHSAAETLRLLDTDGDEGIESILNFRCDNCRAHFLRGAFLSSASVNDPLKSYHLEFLLHNAVRAKKLHLLLSSVGFAPKIAIRRSGTGLYFKNSTAIEDIFTYIGAATMIFECMNDKILREIRNDTNRRANCETGNIASVVKASQNVILAIKKLEALGLLSALPDELKKTADIRMAYPEASLSEICRKFSPPLSKSGLSHRLEKIRIIAEESEK